MDPNGSRVSAVVVDTNVLAYLVLETQPFFHEVRQFWQIVRKPLAPASWQPEFGNLVWVGVRARLLSAEEGLDRLKAASLLGIESVPVQSLWLGALKRSVESGVAVYDTLFVELAARERIPLATFDAKVLAAFPGVAKRPRSFLH